MANVSFSGTLFSIINQDHWTSKSDLGFSLTCVYTYPESQLVIGSVSDLESFDLFQQCQRHPSNLPGMQFSIPYWQPWYNHVGVTNGLDLPRQHDGTTTLHPGVELR